jgi:hypothetical protein
VLSAASSPLSSLASVAQTAIYPASMMMSPLMMLAQGSAQASTLAGATGVAAEASNLVGSTAPAMNVLGGGGGLGSAMSAGLGNARLVGTMSVPAAWQGSMPARMVTAAMSGMGEGLPNAAGSAGGMPVAPMPVGGTAAKGGTPGGMLGRGGASPTHVVQSRPRVVPTGIG